MKIIEEERDLLSQNLKNSETQKIKLLEELKSVKNLNKFEVERRVRSILSSLFTEGQIKSLMFRKKRVKWNIDDYSAAISLRSVSPKAYRYLREKMNFPLPALSTLRKWALNTFDLEEGVLKDVVKILQSNSKSLTEIDRLTVLSYDEMHLSEEVGYDKTKEHILGPCQAVQVVFARGLVGKWKAHLLQV